MASVVQKLHNKGLIKPPSFLPANVHYETLMGSVAYGVSSDTSDMDVYGFCIPPKEVIFPHLSGEILGFGKQKSRFEQYQEHHIDDKELRKTYDLQIFSIVKYFSLCMDNNPNMIDSLFTPDFAVLHITAVGRMVREKRDLFLHKGAWHRFKGYAYSQLHKIDIKNPEGKRKELVEKHGYDTKYAYHVIRLLNEAEQILVDQTIDLQKNREQLKSIRRGEWSLEDLKLWSSSKEADLEKVYLESKLQHSPDEEAIKNLLMNCLEHHYGSLKDAVKIEGRSDQALREIIEIAQKALPRN